MSKLAELCRWLNVLQQLEPFIDPSDENPERKTLNAAWNKARRKASEAAAAWVAELDE